MRYRNREKGPPEVEGPRWNISGRHELYETALSIKESIQANSDLDVKIHKVKGQFLIKTRERQNMEEEETPRPKSKSRRKKNNSKDKRE